VFELRSQFTELHHTSYSEQELIEVSPRTLTIKDNSSLDNAEYTARTLWQFYEQDANIR